MRLKLYSNWREILRRSWAIYFNFIAAIGQTAVIVLPLWIDEIPRTEYAFLTLCAIVASMLSRLVEQKGI